MLPGLAAVLVALGLVLLAVGCSAPRSSVSAIPSSVGTRPPASPSAAPSATVRPVPAVPPVSIRIPAIGVSAPVMQLGLNSDGTIQVPPLADHNLAGWYKYGPAPGQQGPAIIVGHIDSAAGASVFFNLRNLAKGDRIYVTLVNGHAEDFSVDGLQQVPKTDFPAVSVYGPLAYAGLRLVTCGGMFNPATGSYLSDVIVYAHLVT